MQLVTTKLIAPSAFPVLPASRLKKYVYRLGVRLCPSMDLVATFPLLARAISPNGKDIVGDGSESEDDAERFAGGQSETDIYHDDGEDSVTADVWRFNGQRVFSITIENDDSPNLQIQDVSWRSDGQLLAVLTSDNTVRLVNSFGGKTVHRFSSASLYTAPPSPASPRTRRTSARSVPVSSSKTKPSSLLYSTHFSNPKTTQFLLRSAYNNNHVVLDDLLGLNADVNVLLKSPADLPRELANIDVESFLPRLSCLPPIGFGGEDVFSSRTSIDAIFHSNKKSMQNGNVDIVMAGHNDGTLGIRIFDSFELGGIDINSASGMRKVPYLARIVKMASRPFESEVFIIAQDNKKINLHVLGINMKFITKNANTLPILATKATQLQNLLRYLTQIQTQLAREVKTAFDLPSRFLRNINGDLETQDGAGASFTTAAFHSIVTGEVSGALKDWLNEQLGDRGVKRWDKSVGDCLELARRLISEAWCPAVERMGVVISRLNGLAAWSPQSHIDGLGLGLDIKLVEALRETVDVMAIRSEECLSDVIKEISLFASFIKWLKWEVEASALEDTSERLDEMREGADHNDTMRVLQYLESGPQESVLRDYLSNSSTSVTEEDGDTKNFYASFKEQRRRNEGANKQGPAFESLLNRLRSQCDKLFEQIAHSLQKGVMSRHITQLTTNLDNNIMDMRVIPDSTSKTQPETTKLHVIARGTDGKSAAVIHQTIKVSENPAKGASPDLHILKLPGEGEVSDLKFVDDHYFMVLVTGPDMAQIYGHAVGNSVDEDWELRHQFNDGVMEAGMKPAKLEINGRDKRRTVGVIDESGKGYVVLDLDSGDSEDNDGVQDDTMSE